MTLAAMRYAARRWLHRIIRAAGDSGLTQFANLLRTNESSLDPMLRVVLGIAVLSLALVGPSTAQGYPGLLQLRSVSSGESTHGLLEAAVLSLTRS